MVSRKKLEEEIARSKDPVLQKQLQKLLDKRSQRWSEKGKKAKESLNSFLKPLPPVEAKTFLVFFWLLVIVIIVMALIGFFYG